MVKKIEGNKRFGKGKKGAKGGKRGKSAKPKKIKVKTTKYLIECQNTVEDNVITLESFANFLKNNIKNEGKKNNLGEKVAVNTEGYNVAITVKGDFSKSYLKYLSKKYLKKQDMRDYLRVIASGKNTYQLKYFNVNAGDDEDED